MPSAHSPSCAASAADLQLGGGWKTITEKYNYKELRTKVQQADIPGRSKLTTKDEMAAALRQHYSEVGDRIRRRGGKKGSR